MYCCTKYLSNYILKFEVFFSKNRIANNLKLPGLMISFAFYFIKLYSNNLLVKINQISFINCNLIKCLYIAFFI